MDIQILDCTLRDGGYYNHWDFDSNLVNKYIDAISQTGIQTVELGLRSFPRSGFHGPYAYTCDSFLDELNIPKSLRVAVMVDAKTILNSGRGVEASVNELFTTSNKSKVDMVRVAAHFSQISQCGAITKELKHLGYHVGFNMMQAGGRSMKEIRDAAHVVNEWGVVDVLYFADSMGNMESNDITEIVAALRTSWQGALGFHSHNNMGRANANCVEAVNAGVRWIDVTVTGMGRGAGNAQSEILLNDFSHSNIGNFEAEPLYELALEFFGPMQKEMGWGANFAYHFSAMHGIHPSYAQELLTDRRYSSTDIVDALKFLSQSNSASFDSELVQKAFDEDNEYEVGGSWDAQNWCEGEDILILGAGPSLHNYSSAIESFISQRAVKTLSLNFHKNIAEENIYAYVAADTKRLALDIKRYYQGNKLMFTPIRFMHADLKRELKSFDVKDYDLKVVPHKFRMYATGCEIPQRLSVAYAISLCAVGGASRVFLVGFDGYSADDPRQSEMVNTIEVIKEKLEPGFLISLTPTTYPLTQGSVFAPY